MSSRLQLDVRNLSLGRRHLVNAYEVKAGIGVIAGKTVRSMPECLIPGFMNSGYSRFSGYSRINCRKRFINI